MEGEGAPTSRALAGSEGLCKGVALTSSQHQNVMQDASQSGRQPKLIDKVTTHKVAVSPPPSIKMPVFPGAFIASSLIALMSATMSITSPGLLYEWKYNMSPREPSVRPGQYTGIWCL